MSPSLSELLKRPAGERAELAMALWESLSEAGRKVGSVGSVLRSSRP